MRANKGYQAVIFDMDGLMLDAERIAMITCRRAAEDFGYVIADEVYLQVIGRTMEAPVGSFAEHSEKTFRSTKYGNGGLATRRNISTAMDPVLTLGRFGACGTWPPKSQSRTRSVGGWCLDRGAPLSAHSRENT